MVLRGQNLCCCATAEYCRDTAGLVAALAQSTGRQLPASAEGLGKRALAAVATTGSDLADWQAAMRKQLPSSLQAPLAQVGQWRTAEFPLAPVVEA